MSFRFKPDESVADGIKRIAYEQLDKALAELDDEQLDRHETVHQVRKRCKKLRGLLRLVRPVIGDTYRQENAAFRDAARRLSDVRDATAVIETYDDLMDHYADEIDRRAFGPIRAALTRRRTRLAKDVEDLDERLAAFREEMVAARARVAGWPIDAEAFDAASGGLKKTYRRAYRAMPAAYEDPTDERFHEWRKRVKYHWYHTRLLRSVWHPVLQARRRQLKQLSDYLGDDHDLAVFRQMVRNDPGHFGRLSHLQAFLGLLDRRRAELQARARVLGIRAFAEKPRHHVRRLGLYWDAWRAEADKHPRLASPQVIVSAD